MTKSIFGALLSALTVFVIQVHPVAGPPPELLPPAPTPVIAARIPSPPDIPFWWPEPTPEPTPVLAVPATTQALAAAPSPVAPISGALSDEDLDVVLTAAGWPAELWPAAKAVARCESGHRPGAASNRYADAAGVYHQDLGLFQLHQTWLPDGTPGWGWLTVLGFDLGAWADPVTNARAAYAVYRYDVDRGARPWTQWSCKPF